jgi:hypothetical protein
MVERKRQKYYVICTLQVFISLYKIPLIITFSMVIDLPYAVWGIHRSQRNIRTSTVLYVIKEKRLKKASNIENRNS